MSMMKIVMMITVMIRLINDDYYYYYAYDYDYAINHGY